MRWRRDKAKEKERSRHEPIKTRDDLLDPKIEPIVKLFNANGIETFESCQGGQGHWFHEPTVRFKGGSDEGYYAVSVALYHELDPYCLRRYWKVRENELVGPDWEMEFWPRD